MKYPLKSASDPDITLINLDFFQGNLDYFVDLYNEISKRLKNNGYTGYFDSDLFSQEWWHCISCFIMFGFTYEAILNIKKLENLSLVARGERRKLDQLNNKDKLCDNAREFLIEFMHNAFLKIKSNEKIPSGYLDPNIAKFSAVSTYVNAYWAIHMNAFNKTYEKAKNGIELDDSSTIASKEAMQIIKLVQMIVGRSNIQVGTRMNQDEECGKTKSIIDMLKKKIADLMKKVGELENKNNALNIELQRLENTKEGITTEYNELVDTSLTQDKIIGELQIANERLQIPLGTLSRLELIIKLQSALILYGQKDNIQPLFLLEDINFQTRFRAILKKYISDIADSIGIHLSSTATSHATVGSGTFAFHVISPLLNQIGNSIDNKNWNGMINVKHSLHLPHNGDPSKGSIYDFIKLTNNLDFMGFLEFFQWLSKQKIVGNDNFGVVFGKIGNRVKERTPALHREIRECIGEYIKELQKTR